MKKVSIQIICYNQEDFIAKTIESCLQQDYKNLEICIADDCSTDRTYEIVQAFQAQHADIIRSFQQPRNMGRESIQINYNAAMDLCTGEYIALLDGDDIMLPGRITKQVEFLEAHPDHIGVTGWVEAFDNATGESLGNIHSHLNVSDRSTEALISGGNSVPPSLMYRRTPSLRANQSLRIMGDWLLYIELSMLGKIGHIYEYLCRYRLHENNSIKKDLSYDYLLTLDILDHKYGFQFFRETNLARVRYYMIHGKKLMKDNTLKGLSLIFYAIRIRPAIIIEKPLRFILNQLKKIGGTK